MNKTYYIIQIISGNDSLTSHNLNATKDRSRKVANAARRALSPSVESRRLFLKDCDFEAHNGRGEFVTTTSKKKAIKFTTMEAALKYYKPQRQWMTSWRITVAILSLFISALRMICLLLGDQYPALPPPVRRFFDFHRL